MRIRRLARSITSPPRGAAELAGDPTAQVPYARPRKVGGEIDAGQLLELGQRYAPTHHPCLPGPDGVPWQPIVLVFDLTHQFLKDVLERNHAQYSFRGVADQGNVRAFADQAPGRWQWESLRADWGSVHGQRISNSIQG